MKRLSHLKLLDPLALLAFISLTIFCLLFCFFYLDYKAFTRGLRVRLQSQGLLGLTVAADYLNNTRPDFLEVGMDKCNLFEGKWVWDESYPLYQSRDCRFLDDGFRCTENGRPDSFYTKWRWQPDQCNLPRFDPNMMLKALQSRRLVFVGDSIGRNQWESLLCMLSSEITAKDTIYEVNGSPISKHNGFLIFRFKDVNCTIEYYRSPFLVLQSRAPHGAPTKARTTLKLNLMDWSSVHWKDADVLIFNTGHWWNYEKTIRGGCYFQVGKQVEEAISVESAYKKAIETLLDWIHREVNIHKTQVIFRSYAPVHFRGGDWRNGGSCHLEKLPELSSVHLSFPPTWSEYLPPLMDAIKSKGAERTLDVLNITRMTAMRKDGHSSLYYRRPHLGRIPLHRQDCSHWCLPGVPDAWNELIYALIRRNLVSTTNSSGPSYVKGGVH